MLSDRRIYHLEGSNRWVSWTKPRPWPIRRSAAWIRRSHPTARTIGVASSCSATWGHSRGRNTEDPPRRRPPMRSRRFSKSWPRSIHNDHSTWFESMCTRAEPQQPHHLRQVRPPTPPRGWPQHHLPRVGLPRLPGQAHPRHPPQRRRRVPPPPPPPRHHRRHRVRERARPFHTLTWR